MILKNKRRAPITILTLYGPITYSRTILVGADEESCKVLAQMGKTRVCPLDEILGIDRFPFKMTYNAIGATARECCSSRSYKDAGRQIGEKYHFQISETEAKNVAEFVGTLMFDQLTLAAEAESKIRFDNRRRRRQEDDLAYLMADGAMIHLRDKNANPTKGDPGEYGWAESKHAIFFAASDVKELGVDKDGKPRRQILKKDAIGFIGPASEFKKYLILLARRTGFERYSKQVIVVDGCIWLRDMMVELFPHAQIILDK